MESLSGASLDRTKSEFGFWGLLDAVLRRKTEFIHDIFEGVHIARTIAMLSLAIALLSGFYGLVMGAPGGFEQSIASGLKVPALYLLSLAICYPALYVINVLMGSRLGFFQTLALILFALALNAILLASFAPVAAFFSITGSDYQFMKILHVVIFTFSGGWGMSALWHAIAEMCDKSDLYPKQGIRILKIWILVFGFVGTQMAWSLRPYVGAPDMGFEIFREGEKGNNFYTEVTHSIQGLFSDEPKTAKPPAHARAASTGSVIR